MDDRTSHTFLVGVGLDGKDGHRRATRGEDYVLFGGSQETHGRMQDGAEKFREILEQRGKSLKDVDDPEELHDIAREAGLCDR
jgi:hypothetical protein